MSLNKEPITNDNDPNALIQDSDEWRARNMWRQKHAHARIFYMGKRNEILVLWHNHAQGRTLRPSLWFEFTQNKDLWNMAYEMGASMSSHSLHEWAHTELVEEGNELETDEHEQYWLLCVSEQALSKLESLNDDLYTLEYAVQRFLACVLIYAFADIYGKEFTVHYKSHPDLVVDKETVFRSLFKTQ